MKLQDQLHNVENPRDFWTKIGRIGITNERKTTVPLEVLIDDGQVSTDHEIIMRKWKTDYEHLYNGNHDNDNDIQTRNEHLQYVKIHIHYPDSTIFPKPDCTSLNMPITHEEVHKAVYQAKLRKASGIDNIHAEILRNDTCIDLHFKIISYIASNTVFIQRCLVCSQYKWHFI